MVAILSRRAIKSWRWKEVIAMGRWEKVDCLVGDVMMEGFVDRVEGVEVGIEEEIDNETASWTVNKPKQSIGIPVALNHRNLSLLVSNPNQKVQEPFKESFSFSSSFFKP
jgi:hypothetical protein